MRIIFQTQEEQEILGLYLSPQSQLTPGYSMSSTTLPTLTPHQVTGKLLLGKYQSIRMVTLDAMPVIRDLLLLQRQQQQGGLLDPELTKRVSPVLQ